ncbi:hypothetical protein [Falsiroseomonas sp. CW058]|uniref:hypothetical protein n=1 Tax=Falsiroseomonas sp. CW058 TaxID=3388664 RepID=UPI003D3232AA
MSQTTRTKSEFLGLHDPYADLPQGNALPVRPTAEPLMTREKAGELLRATASLIVILVLMAVAVTAFY